MKEIGEDTMERYPVFLDGHVNIFKMSITTQSDLQIQCNPIKIPIAFFHRNIKKILNACRTTKDPK